MICAKTSLPWFIGGPRNGRHHGPANAAIRVEIETRQNHKLSFANQILIAPLALNVGTALIASQFARLEFAPPNRLCALKGCEKIYGERANGNDMRNGIPSTEAAAEMIEATYLRQRSGKLLYLAHSVMSS